MKQIIFNVNSMYSYNFRDLEVHRSNGICHETVLFMKHQKFQNLTNDVRRTRIVVAGTRCVARYNVLFVIRSMYSSHDLRDYGILLLVAVFTCSLRVIRVCVCVCV
jgi:hypothetical protein